MIQCCSRTIIMEFCEAPKKAKIELWDYFKVFPDTLLHSMEIENVIKYSFKWSDEKIFDVKPILKIHVECKDGTIFDEKYDYTETKPTMISQNIKVMNS
uniref:Uncharacterized protein n=1 Tax=Panagrolaimus sp. PS1159 TaxID=55785 RepID=A0AC35FDG3_9BILA